MSVGDTGDRGDKRPASVIERLRALFGLGQGSVREDIEEALDESDDEGPDAFSPQERAMMRNVLNLHDLRVEDVMVPRADVIAVSEDMTLGEVLKEFQVAGHSRLPVHGGTLDDARGMVHIRDFVAHMSAGSLPAENGAEADAAAGPSPSAPGPALWRGTLKESGLIRPVLFVPPSMQALDLLVRMQAFRTHMALVIDEYGGTDGLVSIEDVVEMIVGDIEDEHDESETAKITKNLDGSFVADARADLAEVSEAMGFDLTAGDDAAVETLGGLIGALAGHVPGRGEVVRARDDVIFEILDADPRRIKRVRIIRTPPVDTAAQEAGKAAAPADGKPAAQPSS